MELIDKQYLKTPFYGSRRMTVILEDMGYDVNRKRVQRLMKEMGIVAIYPGPNLSKRRIDHTIYPYLLKGVEINRPNFVWSIDITFIKLRNGYLYLVAIIDWFSRYVLAWNLSNTLSSDFCVDTVSDALNVAYQIAEIFNTDQGSQFTSNTFIQVIKDTGMKISMDGRGRALDNIFIERLWRSLKYEEVYLKDYNSVNEARNGISDYFKFYNNERPHQSLGYRTPREVYFK
jgi:putative transposase